MSMDRRKFLGAAGLATVAVAGSGTLKTLGGSHDKERKNESGTRWAMVIDPQKCMRAEGCDKCIRACHETHNVPSFEDPRHEVKWIWKESFEDAFPNQHNDYTQEVFKKKDVLVFCNHCDNPPCVRVCPTKATWKREDGVVMMDWHRCIGCRYCVAACPYGSRSFNWLDPRTKLKKMDPGYPTRTKGVVEKCTFCEEKLARGEQPACVEACPEGAMVFGNLDDPQSEVRKILRSKYTIRRKAELGTMPEIYYVVR